MRGGGLWIFVAAVVGLLIFAIGIIAAWSAGSLT